MVLTTGGINDLCLKYFVEAGAMAARRCKKEDLKKIAKATGGEGSCDCHVTSASCFPAASVVLTLANLEGEETFDSSLLGQAGEVLQERVCDDELILVKG